MDRLWITHVSPVLRGVALPLVLGLASPGIAGGPEETAPCTPGAGSGEEPVGLRLESEEAEAFLRTARVIEREDISNGITRPERLTLTDGTRTLRAVWKTVDERKRGLQRMERGGFEFDFRDSWKSEVAAYELSKLLGLDFVPATVERQVQGRRGALQMWVEQAMTEKERRRRRIEPDHVPRWNNQMHCVRLFHQLTYNTDFQNIGNILVDPQFRIYVIDSSRAFRIQEDLLAPDDLVCFSRRVLERLSGLDREVLEQRLGRWLDGMQIDSLLARRDRIEALVKKRLEKDGPGKVLFY